VASTERIIYEFLFIPCSKNQQTGFLNQAGINQKK